MLLEAFEGTPPLTTRPRHLDLFLNVCLRGMERDPEHWSLRRVAITERDAQSVFHGALYFGERVQEWAEDCRPSDALYLAARQGAPMYIKKSLWHQEARDRASLSTMLGPRSADTMGARLMQQRHGGPARQPQQQQQATAEPPPALPELGDVSGPPLSVAWPMEDANNSFFEAGDPIWAIRHDDPEVIKLLKRELWHALNEEDYDTAARIRDDSFYVQYREIQKLRQRGELVRARIAEQHLKRKIDEWDTQEE